MKLIHSTLITTATVLLLVGCGAKHHHSDKQKQAPLPKDPAAKAAMMECRNSIAKNENARPNREAMKACMKEKGFEKPEGRGQQR